MTTKTTSLANEEITLTDKLIGFSVLFIIAFLLVLSLSNLFSFVSSGVNKVNSSIYKQFQLFQQANDTLKRTNYSDKDIFLYSKSCSFVDCSSS